MPDKTLQRETLSSCELWQRLRSEQRAASSCNPNAILKLVDLLENTQQQWRTSAQEARRLSDLNDRLKKQNENYSKALEESREYGREMDAKFAAANAQIESLRGELENHKLIIQTASQELQNVTIRRSTLSRQSSYDDQENMEDGQPGHSRGRHLSKSRDRRVNKRQSCSREQPSGKRAKQQHMVDRISEEDEFDGKKKTTITSMATTTTTTNSSGADDHYQLPPLLFSSQRPRSPSRLPVPIVTTPISSIALGRRRSRSEIRLTTAKKMFKNLVANCAGSPSAPVTPRRDRPPAPSTPMTEPKRGRTAAQHPQQLSLEMLDEQSLLGPILSSPNMTPDKQAVKSLLLSRLARNGPLFERPY